MKKAIVEFVDATVEIEQTNESGRDVALLRRGPGRLLTVPWGETLTLAESVQQGRLQNVDGSKLTISLRLPPTITMD
jgi:hypothetical protein